MTILGWIIIGGLAGWIASMIMNTNGQQGLLMDIIIGIGGAFIGGFIASLLGFGGLAGFSFASLAVATGGAVVLLWLYGMLSRG